MSPLSGEILKMGFCLGLTGGIATGKSTAAAFFRQKGAAIIDADQVVHQLEQPRQEGWLAIRNAFGRSFFDQRGQLNRQKLGRLVFSRPAELAKLNSCLQPLIREKIQGQLGQTKGFKVLDAPLLFEEHYQHFCDRILLIAADASLQIKRLQARDGLAPVEADKRIASQLPLSVKAQLADDIIKNNGSRADFLAALTAYWQKLAKEVTVL